MEKTDIERIYNKLDTIKDINTKEHGELMTKLVIVETKTMQNTQDISERKEEIQDLSKLTDKRYFSAIIGLIVILISLITIGIKTII